MVIDTRFLQHTRIARQAAFLFFLLVAAYLALAPLVLPYIRTAHRLGLRLDDTTYPELIIVAILLGEMVVLRPRGAVLPLSLVPILAAPLSLTAPIATAVVAIALIAYHLAATAIVALRDDEPSWHYRHLCHTLIAMTTVALMARLLPSGAMGTLLAHPAALAPWRRLLPLSLAIALAGVLYALTPGTLSSLVAVTGRLLGLVCIAPLALAYALLWHISPIATTVAVCAAFLLRLITRLGHPRLSDAEAATVAQRARSLEVVLTAAQQLTIDDDPIALLEPVAVAAREVTNADDVAVYGANETTPGDLELLFTLPSVNGATPPEHLYLTALGSTLLHAGGHIYLIPIGRTQAGRPRACLRIAGTSIAMGSETHHTLAILAMQSAVALENADAHRRAITQANEDGLTGLTNHRTFQVRLQQEIARARRGQLPLALVMIDLDNFSGINNAYGHQGGDAALIAVAEALRATVREGDIAVRYAGDEFAVILPNTEASTARHAAERICHAICALQVRVTEDAVVPIGCSVGVATLSSEHPTREGLIRMADLAAYAAKRSGKGQVAGEEEVQNLPDLAAVPYEKRKAV